jgi:peptidoglycan/LPS O-acetylase OafA/YrhL
MTPNVKNYLTTLTPLRGIAALVVAIYHFEVVARFVAPESSMFLRKGYLMVDLFFILSGFIMLHVYGATFQNRITRPDLGNFLMARFARIYPLHLFTLLVLVGEFCLKGAKSDPINDPAAIPTHLLLLHSFGLHPVFTWNGPSWSISAEWWAYVVFPLAALLLARYRTAAGTGIALLALLTYVSVVYLVPRTNFFDPGLPVPHNLDVYYDYGFLRGLAGFLTGMLTYEGFASGSVRRLFGRDVTGLVVLAGTVLLLHLGVEDLLYIPAFAAVVLSLAANRGAVQRVFDNRVFRFLGDISYSVYLVHVPFLFWVVAPLLVAGGYPYKGPMTLTVPVSTGLLHLAVYLLVVLAISTLTYYTIEKPCRIWINRRWARRREKPLLAVK